MARNIIFIITLIPLWFSGCAHQSASTSKTMAVEHIESSDLESGEMYWWYARFKITWPPEYPPDMAVDLFIADKVIRPVLEDYSSKLFRWRFHRRANRDPAGHQFSFIFYTDIETAAEIMNKIKSTGLLQEALSSHVIEQLFLDDPDKPSRPALGDTSDPAWVDTLQKHWPAYIMGVSALWLGLIEEYKDKTNSDSELELQELIDTYREAQDRITNVWYEQGQHALLHHLNAIFGYEPILIRKDTRF